MEHQRGEGSEKGQDEGILSPEPRAGATVSSRAEPGQTRAPLGTAQTAAWKGPPSGLP